MFDSETLLAEELHIGSPTELGEGEPLLVRCAGWGGLQHAEPIM